VCQTIRAVLRDIGDLHPVAATIANGFFDLGPSLPDNDADFIHPGIADGLDHPYKDGLVGNRD